MLDGDERKEIQRIAKHFVKEHSLTNTGRSENVVSELSRLGGLVIHEARLYRSRVPIGVVFDGS
jgi:hypothetical protein